MFQIYLSNFYVRKWISRYALKTEEIVNKYARTGNFPLFSFFLKKISFDVSVGFGVLFDKHFINHVKIGIDIRAHFILYFKECLDKGKGLQKSGYVCKPREEEVFKVRQKRIKLESPPHVLRKRCPCSELFWSTFFPRFYVENAGKMRNRITPNMDTFYVVVLHEKHGKNVEAEARVFQKYTPIGNRQRKAQKLLDQVKPQK